MIGAGAAGAMAAIHAAGPGTRVRLLERTRDGGRKILISGGGRCNVLPARLDERRFVTDSSPHTLRKLLRSWPLAEQRSFFERELGLPLVEEAETAKLFPSTNRARDVRDGLLRHAASRGVELHFGVLVERVLRAGARWRLEGSGTPPLVADAVVVATGGLSVPATGSDGTGLALLRELGHLIHPTYPALTPLRADPAPFARLAGVSLPVTLTATSEARQASATGGFLFTHHGYSGPVVLDVSHVAVRSLDEPGPPARLTVQWSARTAPEWDTALRTAGAGTALRLLRDALPDRLASLLLERAGVEPDTPLARLRREQRQALVEALVRFELTWTGHEGYKKAEVTGGGVALNEIDPKTLESRRCPGLFIAGEALDAFGPIGGYNFCWAWATGRAAGLGAAAT